MTHTITPSKIPNIIKIKTQITLKSKPKLTVRAPKNQPNNETLEMVPSKPPKSERRSRRHWWEQRQEWREEYRKTCLLWRVLRWLWRVISLRVIWGSMIGELEQSWAVIFFGVVAVLGYWVLTRWMLWCWLLWYWVFLFGFTILSFS